MLLGLEAISAVTAKLCFLERVPLHCDKGMSSSESDAPGEEISEIAEGKDDTYGKDDAEGREDAKGSEDAHEDDEEELLTKRNPSSSLNEDASEGGVAEEN